MMILPSYPHKVVKKKKKDKKREKKSRMPKSSVECKRKTIC
jgi:hypothetical protein